MVQWVNTLYYTSLMARVQVLKPHNKTGVMAHICNPSALLARWKMVTVETSGNPQANYE